MAGAAADWRTVPRNAQSLHNDWPGVCAGRLRQAAAPGCAISEPKKALYLYSSHFGKGNFSQACLYKIFRTICTPFSLFLDLEASCGSNTLHLLRKPLFSGDSERNKCIYWFNFGENRVGLHRIVQTVFFSLFFCSTYLRTLNQRILYFCEQYCVFPCETGFFSHNTYI